MTVSMFVDTPVRPAPPSRSPLSPVASATDLAAADQTPAVLTVPRPASTAGLHPPGVPAQRRLLPVLPAGPARWFRGLVNPRYLHLLETEDGQPRTLEVQSGIVGIAVCRAWLTGTALDIDTGPGAELVVPNGLVVCGPCQLVAIDLHGLRGAR
jgi:hypothetical protein